MRRTTSTIKRVQALLTTRREKRLERQAQKYSAMGRAAKLEAESRHDGGFGAGQGGGQYGGLGGGSSS